MYLQFLGLHFSAVNPANETQIIIFCLLWQRRSSGFLADWFMYAGLSHSFIKRIGRAGEVGFW